MRQAVATQRLTTLIGFLRPHVGLQASAYVFVGAYLSGAGRSILSATTLTAAAVVALIVAFGFVLNDYMDRELDRIQKPDRPLPAGLVSPNEVGYLGGFTVVASLALSSWLAWPLMLLVWLNLLLTSAYSLWFKRTVLLGNLTIALLNSSIILFGAMAGAGLNPLVWSIATTTLLFSLAQEVLYTVADQDGDRQAGITTTAIFFGAEQSLQLVCIGLSLMLLSSFVPLALGAATPLYLILLLPCTLGPVLLRMIPLTRSTHPEAITAAVALIKQIRVSSLLPLLLLRPPLG